MTFWQIVQIVCSIGGLFIISLWAVIVITNRTGPWLKDKRENRKNCLSCGFCRYDYEYNRHCTANANQDDVNSSTLYIYRCREIPDPKHMGGPRRCSKYITKKELQKRLKTAAINNFEYPEEENQKWK